MRRKHENVLWISEKPGGGGGGRGRGVGSVVHGIGAYVQVTIKNLPGPTAVSAQAKTWPHDHGHKLRIFLSQNFKLV